MTDDAHHDAEPRGTRAQASDETSEGPAGLVVDRFEDGGWAVLERAAGGTIDLPRSWLPSGTREGSTLALEVDRQDDRSVVRFSLDERATEERAERVTDKLARLRARRT